MDTSEIQAAFDDVFDQAMVFHGFADYMRDYEVFIDVKSHSLRSGIRWEHLLYRFTYCVRATVATASGPEGWRLSLDERLVDYEQYMKESEQGRDLDGFVWGVKFQELYPGGMQLMTDSAEAERWSREVGIPFHEAVIEANVHHLSLVFSDLVVQTVDAGYAPFVVSAVSDGGSNDKTPMP